MNTRSLWSRALVILGLADVLIGAIDPIEGSFVILPGMAALWIGAWAGRTASRKLLAWAFLLVAVGVAVMFGLTAMHGIGGRTGRSMWWALLLIPYPVGWVMGLVGAVRSLIQLFRRPAAPLPTAP
ncbi:MAG TPA: hypothetical protein VMS88_03670 [Terriglobales bacterium]|nr:hypothetical protein [Terriglobales bacterium]